MDHGIASTIGNRTQNPYNVGYASVLFRGAGSRSFASLGRFALRRSEILDARRHHGYENRIGRTDHGRRLTGDICSNGKGRAPERLFVRDMDCCSDGKSAPTPGFAAVF
jgi:hypothetical protein